MNKQVIVALDYNVNDLSLEEVVNIVSGYFSFFKVGLKLSSRFGAGCIIKYLKDRNFQVFADMKFYDIPNVVGEAVRNTVFWGADLVSVPISVGERSLKEAVNNRGNSKIVGISVLTSLAEQDCLALYQKDIKTTVLNFAELALDNKLDAIVCSPLEIDYIRAIREFDDLQLLVPGVRPSFYRKRTDQHRIMHPKEALNRGADYVILGRPLLDPPENLSIKDVCELLLKELD